MDFSGFFGLETQTVKEGVHDGKPARIVGGSRSYATDPDDLWDAVTNIERIPRWFSPISGDFKLGGHYKIEGNAEGKILRCEPPKRLHLTWEFSGNISWVHVTLKADGASTNLSLEHITLKDTASEAQWAKYGPGATGVGWDLSFMALAIHLSPKGGAMDPKKFETWTSTEPAKAYIRQNAKDWGEAHIRSGEDKKTAEKMANEIVKFYAPA